MKKFTAIFLSFLISFSAAFVAPGFQFHASAYDSTDKYYVKIIAGGGSGTVTTTPSTATDDALGNPYAMAKDSSGNLYMADYALDEILKLDVTTGQLSTVAGSGTDGNNVEVTDGTSAADANLTSPLDIAIDSSGNIYFIDNYILYELKKTDSKIYAIADSSIISSSSLGYTGFQAMGVTVDSTNNVYFSDYGNNLVLEYDTNGNYSVVAGGGTETSVSYSGNATNVTLNTPTGLAFDSNGYLYIADQKNNLVRKVNLTDDTISTVAGGGSSGFSDGGAATSQQLSNPQMVYLDSSNNLYITDAGSNNFYEVYAASLEMTKVAGNDSAGSGQVTDGTLATSASFVPSDIDMDSSGDLYIVDYNGYVYEVAPKLTTPTDSQNGSAVTLSCDTGATIHYTTDGSTPTKSSTEYTGSITVTDGETVTAIAVKYGRIDSDVMSSTYTVLISVTSATITGTAQVGATLTAAANTGATNVTYQWEEAVSAAGTYSAISGATSSTYVPVANDAGKYIKVVISGDNSSSITSSATSAVGVSTVDVTSATITGTAQVGATLTAAANTGATNVTYQWEEAVSAAGTYSAISGATSSTYVPVANDAGKYIKVVISGDNSSSITSSATSAVGVSTVDVTSATITGTAQVGATLTAAANTGATNVTYQWEEAVSAAGTYSAISGATSSTYVPVANDAGKYIKVVISGDNSSSITSSATSAVGVSTDTTAPTVTTSAISTSDLSQTGVMLDWTEASDNTSAAADLQYCVYYSASNNLDSVTAIETNGTKVGNYTTALTSKTITNLTAGTTYYYNVIVKDTSGNKTCYTAKTVTTITSTDTTPPTVTTSAISTSGLSQTGVTLSWTAASDDTSAAADLRYCVYYSASNNLGSVSAIEANGTKVGDYTAALTSKTITGLTAGTIYYYNVIVEDASGNKTCYTTQKVTTITSTDTTPPTVTTSAISTSGLSQTGVTLSWTAASDDTSAAADLRYCVYYSASNNLGSVSAIEANGTKVGDYTAALTSKTITGLTAGTIYYYNVIVEDASGNKTCYTTQKVTTDSTNTTTTGSSSGGTTTTTKTDNTISGTVGTTTDTASDTTAKITASDTSTSAYKNVIVNVGSVTVTAPASVLSSAIGSDSSNWLVLSNGETAAATQQTIATAAAAQSITPVSTLDVDLTRYSSNGTTEAVHQLSDSVTVAIMLTDAQIAQITSASSAMLLYYNPDTGTFTDMSATFDLSAKTATFKTNHLSTFVIAQGTSSFGTVGVTYDAHVQNLGWLSYVSDGAQAGTTGKSLRLEAINVKLTGDVPTGASITYQVYVKGRGWMTGSDGSIAGTTGKRLRVAAVRITVSGLSGYAVKYKVHIQDKGWDEDYLTTVNGTEITSAAIAGAVDSSLRVEAIEIQIVKV